MKKIISARRQNGQAVFLKDWGRNNSIMTEFQALAFDFSEHYADPDFVAQQKIDLLKEEYAGLMDWKIEDVKE